MAIRIERIEPRDQRGEYPETNATGEYKLVSPEIRIGRNKAENVTLVRSIEEAAELIEKKGYSIRMTCKGKRASLISPEGLRIVRF